MSNRARIAALASRIFERAVAKLLIDDAEGIGSDVTSRLVTDSFQAARAFIEEGEFGDTQPSIHGDLGER